MTTSNLTLGLALVLSCGCATSGAFQGFETVSSVFNAADTAVTVLEDHIPEDDVDALMRVVALKDLLLLSAEHIEAGYTKLNSGREEDALCEFALAARMLTASFDVLYESGVPHNKILQYVQRRAEEAFGGNECYEK